MLGPGLTPAWPRARVVSLGRNRPSLKLANWMGFLEMARTTPMEVPITVLRRGVTVGPWPVTR